MEGFWSSASAAVGVGIPTYFTRNSISKKTTKTRTKTKKKSMLLNSNLISTSSRRRSTITSISTTTRRSRVSAIFDDMTSSALTSSLDPPPPEIDHLTWQILLGTLAGVIPFLVAAIEFTKRIVAQRKCGVCRGSGLVLRDNKYYFRCHSCGGFLPWQSWKRFFSG